MSLEDQIGSLTQAATDLTNTVNTRIASIDARVAAKEAEVDAFVASAQSSYPAINMLPDSGRFVASTENPASRSVGPFVAPNYLAPFNGSSPLTEVGKFIYDNATYGGADAAITQTVIDLLTKMGRTADPDNNARYGLEFYIGQVTMGTGTALAYQGKYSLCSRSIYLTGPSDRIVTSLWLRTLDDDILFQGRYRNGVDTGVTDQTITAADGWTHVARVDLSIRGYIVAYPRIYASANTRVQIALPFMGLGNALPGVHKSHIPTINSALAL